MIDINKKYMTRDGFPVRIVADNLKGRYPILGVIDLGEEEHAVKYTSVGKADRRPNVRTPYDLVEVEKGGEQ